MYRILYTPLAREDMLEILIYVSEDLYAPQSAARLLNKIEKDISRLGENPYSAPVARDEYLASQEFRYLVSGKYIVLYKVDDVSHNVIVYRIVYGARNLALLFPEIIGEILDENKDE